MRRLILTVSFALGATIVSLVAGSAPTSSVQQRADDGDIRVSIESDGWQLIGDLRLPAASADSTPMVLLLNKAAGDRTVYAELAGHLASRGVASLRLDLRGHGESTNLGRFVPGERDRSPMIWDSDVDVVAAHKFLAAHPTIDRSRIAIVGASYSGEEMAEAGRRHQYARAYVALSPGSFSDESIEGIDASGASWLFITSKKDRYLQEIESLVHERSQSVEQLVVPGSRHASDILIANTSLAERIAIWLDHQLR